MHSASTSLPASPGSVPAARRWARAALASWGYPEAGWTAAQIVSELATNVTLHARTSFTVTVTAEHGCARLEVADGVPGTPQTRQYGLTATTGRGLHIVDSLAVEWGVTPGLDGKTVWALLRLDDVRGDEDASGRSADSDAASSSRPVAPSGTVALRWSA